MSEKIKLDRLSFFNRWKMRKTSRPCDWTILGFSKWWFGPESFCYKLCFFGFEVKIWFNRTFV